MGQNLHTDGAFKEIDFGDCDNLTRFHQKGYHILHSLFDPSCFLADGHSGQTIKRTCRTLVELINETFMTMFVVFLYLANSLEAWDEVRKTAFFSLLIVNTLMFATIISGKSDSSIIL